MKQHGQIVFYERREVPVDFESSGKTWICAQCAAEVASTKRHAEWHRTLADNHELRTIHTFMSRAQSDMDYLNAKFETIREYAREVHDEKRAIDSIKRVMT